MDGGGGACLVWIGWDGVVEDTEGWYGIGAFAFAKGRTGLSSASLKISSLRGVSFETSPDPGCRGGSIFLATPREFRLGLVAGCPERGIRSDDLATSFSLPPFPYTKQGSTTRHSHVRHLTQMTRILFQEGCTRSAVAHTPYLEQGFYLLC